nr:SMAD/FHA domain, microspherule protein domain protein [Tanacetum cinerariifolium]
MPKSILPPEFRSASSPQAVDYERVYFFVDSIEAGDSLDALAKGAVNFSRAFTLHKLLDQWRSLLYDPVVSAQASARMDKVEPSSLNPLSTISSVDDVEGNENSPNKRKWGSIYRRYYAMRKKIKDTLFSSPGVGFSEKCNNHSHSSHGGKFQDDSTLDDEDQVGNDMNDSCVANNLSFAKTDFQIKRQDFPETIGSIATTAVFDKSADAFHAEGCHTTIENRVINRSVGEDELCKQTAIVQPSLKKMRLFDPSIKSKDETHMHKCDSGKCMSNEELGPSRTVSIGKILKASEFQAQPVLTYDSINENNHILCSEFGGKHNVNLPGSDGSAESTVIEETLAPAEDGDTRRDDSSGVEASQSVFFLGDEPDGTDFIYSSAVRECEYENLPDSLLNFSNKDSLYVNVVSISAMDDIPISQLLDSPEYVSEDSTFHVDQQGVCHWQADVSSSHPDSPELSEGNIICILNTEDPNIPQLSEGDISSRLNIEDTEIPQLSEGGMSCRLNIEDTEIPQLREGDICCRLNIEDAEIPQLSQGDISCRLTIEDTEIPQLGEWGVSCRLDIEDTEIPEFSKGDISFRLNIEDTEILQLSEGGVSCRSYIEDTEIPQLGEWGISCRLNIEDTKIPQLSEGGINCRSNIEDTELPQLSEGICRLNIEDPNIPCNDEIFLLIHPSISFDLSITSIATDSIDPSSSSEDENDDEQESSASKVPALSFTQSQIVCLDSCSEFDFTHPLIGHILKSESSDTKCLDPLSGQCDEIRDLGKPQYMLTNSVLIGDRGFTEDGLDDSETDSEVSLQTEVGSLKMIDPESMDNSSISDHNSADSDGDLPCFSDTEALTKVGSPKMIVPESMDDSSVSDHNNADSDGDLPCFSDIEALIHGIGLEYSQDSCITSEVARHHYNHSNRTITRPQRTARSSLQRAMSSLGALAIFYSRQFDYYIKKTEVTIGRSTADTEVDIDLRKEDRANMISRRQATIKMDVDGTFTLRNIGKSSISMNGNSVAPGQVVALGSSSLIEIRGINFMFEINDRYVRQYMNNIIKKSHGKTTTFEWSPEGEPRR